MIKDFAIKGSEEQVQRFLKAVELYGWKTDGIEDYDPTKGYPAIWFNCDKNTPEDTDGLKFGYYWATHANPSYIYNIDTVAGWNGAMTKARIGIGLEEEPERKIRFYCETQNVD